MDPHRTVQAVWKLESARLVAGLTRLVHDVGRAEEFAQDALVEALEQWPRTGVPDNPGGWLMTTARRRAIDAIRRDERFAQRAAQLVAEEPAPAAADDTVRLMVLSCHPLLSAEERVALTLRLVAGVSATEIARAYLTSEAQILQRLGSAKRKLVGASLDDAELDDRLADVLGVVYLIFNEGYSATAGSGLIRADLCREALRLGRILAELAPDQAEVHGLVALMEIQASRAAARTGPDGEPIPLEQQDRTRWDPLLIRRGFAALLRARDLGGTPGPYVLQAAIAASHAQARQAADTDWSQISLLYDALAQRLPTPIVRLNRAVAIGRASGPAAALPLVDELLDDPVLRDYHLLPSVRGDLLARLGRTIEARREFERAADLATNASERAFLSARAAELPAQAPAGASLGAAVEAYLQSLDPTTRRSYGQTLGRLGRALGVGLPLAELTTEAVARAVQTAWAGTAAATWNRHRAALRSFAAWVERDELAAGLQRRAGTTAAAEPLPPEILTRLWRDDVPLRERTLWRLLQESGAPVSAALGLNVEDLDLDDRRARTGQRWITWRSNTAALLPALIAGRARGPLFLTNRRPGPRASDRCPETGRQRLSYERAEYLFKRASSGHTLRQLRRS